MKKFLVIICSLAVLLCFSACGTETKNEKESVSKAQETTTDQVIKLNGSAATYNGVEIEEFEYVWHCDPSTSHDDEKNAPAEYYTGVKPETDAAMYIDHDLPYFPKLSEDDFKLVNYDGEQEWAYYYKDGEHNDYIFATLPHFGNTVPTSMMFTEEEASKNKVLHIQKPGTYTIEGTWKGQIRIDLGDEEETFTDESKKVTLILKNADVTCSVAPAIVFYSAYECDNTWEEKEEHTVDVDTQNAGVNVVIADGSTNKFNGKNIFRMLKTKYKDDDSTGEIKVQKKMRKLDAAFYSYVTMNIDGEEKGDGTLEVTSSFEGLDSELHLSVNGGKITINSQDDGMNVNEDNVSVIAFNGGEVTLNAGLGAEGDGVDSNGFIKIDGGTLSINGIKPPDSALDSEEGATYLSGKVIIDGEEQSYEKGQVIKETVGGPGKNGDPKNSKMGADFDLKEFKEKVAELPDDATFEDVLEILGMDQGNMGGPQGEEPPEMPNGEPPEKPNN